MAHDDYRRAVAPIAILAMILTAGLYLTIFRLGRQANARSHAIQAWQPDAACNVTNTCQVGYETAITPGKKICHYLHHPAGASCTTPCCENNEGRCLPGGAGCACLTTSQCLGYSSSLNFTVDPSDCPALSLLDQLPYPNGISLYTWRASMAIGYSCRVVVATMQPAAMTNTSAYYPFINCEKRLETPSPCLVSNYLSFYVSTQQFEGAVDMCTYSWACAPLAGGDLLPITKKRAVQERILQPRRGVTREALGAADSAGAERILDSLDDVFIIKVTP